MKFPYCAFNSNIKKYLLFGSTFGDIYDEDHFIAALEGHVKVVKELPEMVLERYDHSIATIPTLRVQAWAPVRYYKGEVYPILQRQG